MIYIALLFITTIILRVRAISIKCTYYILTMRVSGIKLSPVKFLIPVLISIISIGGFEDTWPISTSASLGVWRPPY